ncbi:amidohydrolase family protein [Paraburkholderia madseniana]|uniref:Amidohydrolase family protein n=1 Tax=Paraburkholderia madseniana TaxID=2599607 RepID=A0A6N6W8M6_9BURK|nr:amidohydrolase family protein [Paraburkholderia madseniana]KAE8757027.1 amidohydrolase family protein [Paraburkholderia madseniana]
MSTFVLERINVFDPASGTRREGVDVCVKDGVIASIGTVPTSVSPDARYALPGHTLLPGFIDLHVHVVASKTNLGANAVMPNFLAALRTVPIVRGMLNRGFTTVRDAGGADFGMCEAVNTGVLLGPRILSSGKALSQTGGHGDFRPRSDQLSDACGCLGRQGAIARVVDGEDAIRLAVREEILKGATQIKVMASGGVASPNDSITNTQYSEAELRAAVEEAEAAGTYVMAHAYTPRAIRRAIECGVRCIEHGNLVDEATARMMVERNVYMVPTLATLDHLFAQGPTLGFPPESLEKIDAARSVGREALRLLARVGVKAGFGSDMLGELHTYQSDEFEARAQIVGNLEAIRSATSVAAEIIGEAGVRGTVSVGAKADLVVVAGDPVENLSLLLGQGEHIPMVIKAGVCVKQAGQLLEPVAA